LAIWILILLILVGKIACEHVEFVCASYMDFFFFFEALMAKCYCY